LIYIRDYKTLLPRGNRELLLLHTLYIKQAFKLEHNFTKVKILFLFSEIYKNFTSSVEIKYEKNARMKYFITS